VCQQLHLKYDSLHKADVQGIESTGKFDLSSKRNAVVPKKRARSSSEEVKAVAPVAEEHEQEQTQE
jgi:hypothetical protein